MYSAKEEPKNRIRYQFQIEKLMEMKREKGLVDLIIRRMVVSLRKYL